MAERPDFLGKVLNQLKALIDAKVVTPSNTRVLGHSTSWTLRSGGVALGPFLKAVAIGFALQVAAGWGFAQGREFRATYFYELDRFGSEAEAEAYNNLMERLIYQTTKGTLVLCDGMSYAEAATRLQINFRTSPTQPYWNILCGSNRAPGNSGTSAGDPAQPDDADSGGTGMRSNGPPACPTRRCGGPYSASRPQCLAYGDGAGACPDGYHSKNRYGCCRGW